MQALTNTPRVTLHFATMSTVSTCTVSSNGSHDSSIYVRAWRFVQRRLHLRPRASSCPTELSHNSVDEYPRIKPCVSYSCDWQRFHMLKEVEEVGARAQWRAQQECIKEAAEWTRTDASPFRTQAQRKTAQVTCHNCGLLYFSWMSVAVNTSAFCGRDCQSTFEYRRELQNIVDGSEPFR